MKKVLLLTFLGIISSLLIAQDGSDKPEKVIHHLISKPQEMTIFEAFDYAGQSLIAPHVFQPLVAMDFYTYKMAPVLAENRPKFVQLEDSTWVAQIEIRKEAKWDNGEPITGHDVAFTLKLAQLANSTFLPNDLKKVSVERIDKNNPKKFYLKYDSYNHLHEFHLSELLILPSYIYDPESILSSFTLAELSQDSLNNHVKSAYQQSIEKNNLKHKILGSGAYTFASQEWDETNHKITLELKPNWWGHQLSHVHYRFEAFPKNLIFHYIRDYKSIPTRLNKGEFDVAPTLWDQHAKDFEKSSIDTFSYNIHSDLAFAFDYIGMHLKNPKLSDVNTRKALAHAMDIDDVIQNHLYGYAEPTYGFTSKKYIQKFNDSIQPYTYNLERAKELLQKSGWTDSDKDGVLDKKIEGKIVPLSIELMYNEGNFRREYACKALQKNAKKIGIKINLVILSWKELLSRVRSKEYEMYISGWSNSSIEYDVFNVWHSSSYEDGFNFVGLSSEKIDAVVSQLVQEENEAKRNELNKKLDALVHDQVPYIFLLRRHNHKGISKRFKNVRCSSLESGFWSPSFKLKK